MEKGSDIQGSTCAHRPATSLGSMHGLAWKLRMWVYISIIAKDYIVTRWGFDMEIVFLTDLVNLMVSRSDAAMNDSKFP